MRQAFHHQGGIAFLLAVLNEHFELSDKWRTSELCGTHTAQPCAAQYCCSRATASWKVRALVPAPTPLLLAGAGMGGLGLGSRATTVGPAVLCAAPAAARQGAGVLWGAALAVAAHLQEQRHISWSCAANE